ncbi:MAG: VWA domain-containing protein [Sandaracinaceae bacterium]|nr:VWA domain-containing protein [Sandaracinaceae bacterium]
MSGWLPIALERPSVFWAFLLLALWTLALGRSKLGLASSWPFTLFRLLAFGCAALAFAGAQWTGTKARTKIGVWVDPSPGIHRLERQHLLQRLHALDATRDEIEIAEIAIPPSQIQSRNQMLKSIATFLWELRQKGASSLVIASDGRSPHLGEAALFAKNAGFSLAFLPVGASPPIDEFAILGIEAPHLLRPGEEITSAITIRAKSGVKGEIELRLGEQPLARIPFRASGDTLSLQARLSIPRVKSGIHRLEAIALGVEDAVSLNNRWSTLVEVLPPVRVWIHAPDPQQSILSNLFEKAGMEVKTTAPAEAPDESAGYDETDLVVFEEVDLDRLSEAQARAIRKWVEDGGGGLITITGEHPVRSSPSILREIEPIKPPEATSLGPKPLELMIVLDRSSSMAGVRMVQARMAAIAVIQSLRADSRVGLVAFSGSVDLVVRPVPMNRAHDLAQVIAGIRALGGTNIAAALVAANRALSHDPRYRQHVILISDGESEVSSAIAAAMALAGSGATISTIMIGMHSPLLAEIARIGRGRYRETTAEGLRASVLSEARALELPASQEGAVFIREATPFYAFEGLSFRRAPPLGGQSQAALRQGALAIFVGRNNSPLLAHWQRGLGQVASWTSASSGRWASAFRNSPLFEAMWLRLASFLARRPKPDEIALILESNPEKDSSLLLTAITSDPASTSPPLVRLFRKPLPFEPGDSSLSLERIGPGLWRATIDEGEGFLVDARMPSSPLPQSAIAFDRPPDPRLHHIGPHQGELQSLTQLTNGYLLETPNDISKVSAPESSPIPLSTPLFLLALTFYLFSVFLHRVLPRLLEGHRSHQVSR